MEGGRRSAAIRDATEDRGCFLRLPPRAAQVSYQGIGVPVPSQPYNPSPRSTHHVQCPNMDMPTYTFLLHL